jgi:hypothetical protein
MEKELVGVTGMFDSESKYERLPVDGSIPHQLFDRSGGL